MGKNTSKIRASKDINPATITRTFVLANLGLIAIAAIIWLHPLAASWNNARDVLARQRQTYAAYQLQAGQYPGLHTAQAAHHVMPYAGLAAAMSEVRAQATGLGLETDLFTATEPVASGAGTGEHFVEVRVIASFSGLGAEVDEFVHGLAGGPAFIRNLHMDIIDDTTVSLRVEFSLFGRGE